MIIETSTLIEIHVSFSVSAPEAFNTVELMDFPVFFRYFARAYFTIIDAIITM